MQQSSFKIKILLAAGCVFTILAIAPIFWGIYTPNMYRGFMLDCSRQFFNATIVKNIIDELASNNYTHLHLHISDNERFSYFSNINDGKLALVNGNKQYFTRNDIREIVKHGQTRNIIVFGEIEFMGHALPWKQAYPEIMSNEYDDEFNMSHPQTNRRITEILDELIPLFNASSMWHMANDEVSQPVNEINKSLKLATAIADNHKRQAIIWDDPIIEADIEVDTDQFIVQAWHNNATNTLIDKGYRTIISEMDYWYIGGKHDIQDYDPQTIKLKHSHLVVGAELVWFTNSSIDDPNDIQWVFDYIKDASYKMNQLESLLSARRLRSN